MRGEMHRRPRRDEILQGLRARNPELINALFGAYGNCLFHYLRVLTGDRDTAEDISQETWAHVLERGDQYSGAYGFQTWLYTIGHNLAIDQFRHKQPASLDALLCAQAQFEWPVSTSGSLPDRIYRDEMQVLLRRQIRLLPRRQQEVVMLRLNDDLTLAEIASATNLPLSTAKRRFYRAVRVLEKQLSPSAIRLRRRLDFARRSQSCPVAT